MALDNQATFVVSTGHFYTADPGTPIPEGEVLTDWEDMGHTSLDEVLGFDSEGGEATTLGTLQAPQLRTKHAPRIESFNITLQQFDEGSLKLFYGSNAAVVDGHLQVPINPTPTVAAFYARLVDGANVFEIYVPRSEIFRGDNFEISDTDSLASLPINVKPVQHASNNWLFSIKPLGA